MNELWNLKTFEYKILLLKISGNFNICQFKVTYFDSDKDPLFVSNFWLELFKLQRTMLQRSYAYHPKTDGQSDVIDICFDCYLNVLPQIRLKLIKLDILYVNCNTVLEIVYVIQYNPNICSVNPKPFKVLTTRLFILFRLRWL